MPNYAGNLPNHAILRQEAPPRFTGSNTLTLSALRFIINEKSRAYCLHYSNMVEDRRQRPGDRALAGLLQDR